MGLLISAFMLQAAVSITYYVTEKFAQSKSRNNVTRVERSGTETSGTSYGRRRKRSRSAISGTDTASAPLLTESLLQENLGRERGVVFGENHENNDNELTNGVRRSEGAVVVKSGGEAEGNEGNAETEGENGGGGDDQGRGDGRNEGRGGGRGEGNCEGLNCNQRERSSQNQNQSQGWKRFDDDNVSVECICVTDTDEELLLPPPKIFSGCLFIEETENFAGYIFWCMVSLGLMELSTEEI